MVIVLSTVQHVEVVDMMMHAFVDVRTKTVRYEESIRHF